jgi:hypothetical protein
MLRRMNQPNGAINSPSTKGMRQPQASNCSGVSNAVVAAPTTAPTNTAAAWLAERQLTR